MRKQPLWGPAGPSWTANIDNKSLISTSFTPGDTPMCPPALCAGPKGPHGGILLSSFKVDWRGPEKSPRSAALTETQHQLGSLRDQESEYRKAVDYGVHASPSAANLRKGSSVTPVRTFQVLRLAETEDGWRRWPGPGFNVTAVARSVLRMKNAFNVSFWLLDYHSIILQAPITGHSKQGDFIALWCQTWSDFIAGNCLHLVFSFQ